MANQSFTTMGATDKSSSFLNALLGKTVTPTTQPTKTTPQPVVQAQQVKTVVSQPKTSGVLSSAPNNSNTYQPLFDYQKSVGGGTSMQDLNKLAISYGMQNYSGTDEQNRQLSSMLAKPKQTVSQQTQTTQPATQTSGMIQQQPSVPKIDTTTYSGMINALANQNVMNNPDYQAQLKAYQDAVNQKAQFESNLSETLAANRLNPIPLEFQQGREQVIQQQNALKQQALQNAINQQQAGLGITQTSQQLAQGALGTAAGLIPEPLRYSGSNSIEAVVGDVAQKVSSGQMTYDQAQKALAGYGQAGVNALQQALPGGFNQAQSAALAQQQGTITPAYNFAKKALQTLSDTVSNLGVAQGTNLPVLNAIGNFAQGEIYRTDATRQYRQAVQEARAAYSQLLAVGGATPTAADARAMAAIPDNATPNDIAAAIASLESLGGAKVGIYANPGTSNLQQNTGAQTGNTLFSW